MFDLFASSFNQYIVKVTFDVSPTFLRDSWKIVSIRYITTTCSVTFLLFFGFWIEKVSQDPHCPANWTAFNKKLWLVNESAFLTNIFCWVNLQEKLLEALFVSYCKLHSLVIHLFKKKSVSYVATVFKRELERNKHKSSSFFKHTRTSASVSF